MDLIRLSHLFLKTILKALWFNGPLLESFQEGTALLGINSFSHKIVYEIRILLRVKQIQVMPQLKTESKFYRVLLLWDRLWIKKDIFQIQKWEPFLILRYRAEQVFDKCFSIQFLILFWEDLKISLLNSKLLDFITSYSMIVSEAFEKAMHYSPCIKIKEI